MNYIQVVARGKYQGQDMVNVFWYLDRRSANLTENDLEEVLTAWTQAVQPHYVANKVSAYQLVQIEVQGWLTGGDKSPYLPLIAPRNVAGGIAHAGNPPIVAMVLSCRLTPVTRDPVTQKYITRSYWAMGAAPTTWLHDSGIWHPQAFTHPSTPALIGALKATLAVTALGVDGAIPIGVGRYRPGQGRGYSLIRDVVARQEISTRRSRKVGKGS